MSLTLMQLRSTADPDSRSQDHDRRFKSGIDGTTEMNRFIRMKLYMGDLHDKHDIVKYPYDASHMMYGDSWIIRNQVWVLLKCVKTIVVYICIGLCIFSEY